MLDFITLFAVLTYVVNVVSYICNMCSVTFGRDLETFRIIKVIQTSERKNVNTFITFDSNIPSSHSLTDRFN